MQVTGIARSVPASVYRRGKAPWAAVTQRFGASVLEDVPGQEVAAASVDLPVTECQALLAVTQVRQRAQAERRTGSPDAGGAGQGEAPLRAQCLASREVHGRPVTPEERDAAR